MKDTTLYFLVPSLEQPRVIKRILQSQKEYSKIYVLGFTREIYSVHNYKKLDGVENISYEIVGSFKDSDLFKRLFLYIKLIWIIFKKCGFKSKNIYVFGFDLRFVSAFIINKNILYEISDIMWLYKSDWQKKVLRMMDFYFAKHSKLVIFTSAGFYREYFSFLNSSKVEIKENKFQSHNLVQPLLSIRTDKIRIAYVGAFRYKNIIDYLIQVCSDYSDKVVLSFYGDGEKSIVSKVKLACELNNNIKYFGPFKNPEGLEKIYNENNLNFVAYDNRKPNERVAMPNKFYESGFFNIPIVCSCNTYVGDQVMKLKIGWVIEPTIMGIDKFISSITINDIIEKHEASKKLDRCLFQEN